MESGRKCKERMKQKEHKKHKKRREGRVAPLAVGVTNIKAWERLVCQDVQIPSIAWRKSSSIEKRAEAACHPEISIAMLPSADLFCSLFLFFFVAYLIGSVAVSMLLASTALYSYLLATLH